MSQNLSVGLMLFDITSLTFCFIIFFSQFTHHHEKYMYENEKILASHVALFEVCLHVANVI